MRTCIVSPIQSGKKLCSWFEKYRMFLKKGGLSSCFSFLLAERMMEKRFLQNRVLALHSYLSASNPQRLIPQLEQKLNLLP